MQTVTLNLTDARRVHAYFSDLAALGHEVAREIAVTAAKVVDYLDPESEKNVGALVPISVEMYFDGQFGREDTTLRVAEYLLTGTSVPVTGGTPAVEREVRDCYVCGGDGWLASLPEGQSTCAYCNGTGKVDVNSDAIKPDVWKRGMPFPDPKVGMPASYCILGDSYPGEISHVSKTGHKIGFRHLDSPARSVIECTRRKNGRYRPTGNSSAYILVGAAQSKRDPHV